MYDMNPEFNSSTDTKAIDYPFIKHSNDVPAEAYTKEGLKGSGERRHFDTGAVRDIVEGKGRCDLMPLIEIAEVYAYYDEDSALFLNLIGQYIVEGKIEYIRKALAFFIDMLKMTPQTYFLDLSHHYENGAKKYEERNWEKGIPLHSFVDSGVRHFLKYKANWQDEPHHLAVGWNLLGAMWTVKHHPNMIDLPFKES